MSDLSRLLEHREQILSAIGSSTAFAPVSAELCEFLEQSLSAAQGRSQAALERSQARSAAIRTGIRQAVGALPVEAWGVAGAVQRRIEIKGPERYGLRRIPDLQTVRAVLREMVDERKSRDSVLKPSPEHGE